MGSFGTFSFQFYQNNGGNLEPLFGLDNIAANDYVWTEEAGGSGSINDTLELNEVYSEPNFVNNFEYLGFIDSGTAAGRLYVFNEIGGFDDYVVASLNDAFANGPDTNEDFPDVIPLASLITTDVPHCFVTGTRIRTPDQDRPVEDLSIGDLVMTAGGKPVAIKWIGRQRIPFPAMVTGKTEPVRIEKGALGPNVPSADLYVSADHGMIIDGLVVNAGALVNGTTISYAKLTEAFTYYHIETEAHDVLLAEGTPAESFIDVASREKFDNYQEYLELYGVEGLISQMSLPRVSSQRLLPETLKARLGIRGAEAPLKESA